MTTLAKIAASATSAAPATTATLAPATTLATPAPITSIATLDIRLPHTSYSILIGGGILREGLRRAFAGRPAKIAAVVSDENVWALHGGSLASALRELGIECHAEIIAPGERSKSLASLETLYSSFFRAGLRRDSPVIAFGGGVTGDLAGFAAATYMRGTPLIQIPTTLLAQVDSSVGGKVAVNLGEGKNLVGSFYQPSIVIADTDLLSTLPPREIRAGLAEVIKYAAIGCEGLLPLLERAPLSGIAGVARGAGKAREEGEAHMESRASAAGCIGGTGGASETGETGATEQPGELERLDRPDMPAQSDGPDTLGGPDGRDRLGEIVRLCCAGKASYVERDERDTGDRMMLNFGHTFGHAIEKLFSYKTYNHGEAVSIGMMMAVRAGELMGATDPAAAGALGRLLDSAGLCGYRESFDMERLIPLMSGDKKNASGGGISLVLLKKFGSPFAARASQQELAELFRREVRL
ncbi:MAG: 3-dehydroquinate synthase [Clostridiales bacterium]|jgi:3-dehydroquinate synthase|nr:3-dehydroquinate synthase [Clostridiales bacterium]